MSEDEKKNAFSEKTVVQSRNPAPAPTFESSDDNSPPEEAAAKPQVSERTVVYAQSNLKETFDARTVVRPSAIPAPATAPAATEAAPTPAPAAKKAAAKAAPPEFPAEAPVNLSPAASVPEVTDPGIRVSTASKVARLSEEEPKKKLSQSERRAQRAALDRKTRTMIAAAATCCALVILCLIVAVGGPKSGEKTTSTSTSTSTKPVETREVASEAPTKVPQNLPTFQGTTDVLSKFDQAVQRAQSHALDYTK